MALRNQPYLPLYVNDFLTDEKLIRCSASTNGVYIRLMCQMHKSEEYGIFLIKDKDKISDDVIDDFARVFSQFSPYDSNTVRDAFQELLDEDVIYIYRNKLCQKRMIKDNEISEKRAISGKKGATEKWKNNKDIHNKFATEFAIAKPIANTEYDNEDINNNINTNNNLLINKEYIIDYYINNINNNITGIEYEKLEPYIESFENNLDMIKYAIDICIINKAYHINYLCKILESYIKNNFKTIEDIKGKELKFKEQKEETKEKEELFDYNWLDDDGDLNE